MLATLRTIGLVLFTGLFTPRRCAQRTERASPATVWMAHLVGLLLGSAITISGLYSVDAIILRCTGDANRSALESMDWGETTGHVAAAIGAGILATLFAALVALPFAWRDEPVRSTWRHTLRTVRLFAPAWMAPAGALSVAFGLFAQWPNLGHGPAIGHIVLLLAISGLPLWCLRTLAGAVSMRGPAGADDGCPLCESCGYLLQHLPVSGLCPECGASTAPALDPTHRSFPQAAAGENLPSAAIAAWIRPAAFFSRMRLDQPVRPLIIRAGLGFVAATGTAYVVFLMGFGMLGSGAPPPRVVLASMLVFVSFATCTLGLWCAGAGIVGWVASAQTGRNLLRATLIVASYTSSYFVAWYPLTTCALVGIAAMGAAGLLHSPRWCMLFLLACNVAATGAYVYGVWRRMRYVRYGNWRFPTAGGGPSLPRSSRPHP